MGKKVLVVDDEKLIVKGLRFSLEQDDMEVDCAYDGEEALEYARAKEYDIVLLDVMLPKLDGFQVCQQIREFSNMPIIMLTAKGDDMDKILGLEYGADDYITKPFEMKEVLARIEAVLRRAAGDGDKEKPRRLVFDKLIIDLDSFELIVDGKRVETPPKEMELIYHLASNPNRVFTRDQLLERIWSTDYVGETRTVDVHIGTLRTKLGQCGEYIRTVRGVGYRMEA